MNSPRLRMLFRPGVLPVAVGVLLLGATASSSADDDAEAINNVPLGATLRASVDGASAEISVSPLEPLNFPGTPLEQMIRLIEERQRQLRQVQGGQDALFQRLDQAADRHILLTTALEGNDTLVADLRAYLQRVEQSKLQRENRERAQRMVHDKEQALREARAALERRRGEVVVQRGEVPVYDQRNGRAVRTGTDVVYRVARTGERGALPATQELQKIESGIERNRKLINDRNTGKEQREFISRRTLPPLLRHKEQIEAALREGTSTQSQAIARAEAQLTGARQALQNMGTATPPSSVQWGELQGRYRQVSEAMRTTGTRLPVLPDDPATGPTATLSAIDRLATARTGLTNEREQVQAQMNQTMGELETAERRLIALNQAVVRLLNSGAVLAGNTLVEIGTPATDPVVAELQELQLLLNEGAGLFSNFDKRLGHLERVHKMAGVPGGNITAGVRSRLQIYNKTFGTLKTVGSTGLKVRQMLEQLQSPRTAIEGLATILELAGPLAGKVPVVGQTMGQFLGFYAKATAAIGRQATRIQDHIIQDTLNQTLIAAPPERRLYTTQQVGDAVRTRLGMYYDDRKQIEDTAKRLQVRRLIALLNGQQ